MRWRREPDPSLAEGMHALDHRRDEFTESLLLRRSSREPVRRDHRLDVEGLEAWLFEERRRLVRVSELRCEELWLRAVSAEDDTGQTPVHWASSGEMEEAFVAYRPGAASRARVANGREWIEREREL